MKDKNELEKLGKTANMLKSKHFGREWPPKATLAKKVWRKENGKGAYEDASFIPSCSNKQILNAL